MLASRAEEDDGTASDPAEEPAEDSNEAADGESDEVAQAPAWVSLEGGGKEGIDSGSDGMN